VRRFDPKRSRIVLLGVPEYADAELPDVPQVTRNVADLAAVLVDPALGGFEPQHCQVAPPRATVADVGKLLRAAGAEAEDLLLFYYGGHGLLSYPRRELHLSVYETGYDEPGFTALAFQDIRDSLIRSRAQSRVVILDCCFSGRATADTLAGLADVVLEQAVGTYTMAATPGSRPAMVLDGEAHTAFSGRLLDLLRSGIPSAGEVLDLDTIYRHLYVRMITDGLPPPQQRSTENASRLGLVRNRRHSPRTGNGAGADATDTDLHTVSVAHFLGEAGDRAAAIRLYQQVLPSLTRRFGAGGLQTLAARCGLAHNAAESGELSTAAELYRDLLPDLTAAVGPSHPAVLDARRRLAFTTGRAGDLDGAIDQYQALVESTAMESADAAWARRQLAYFVGERGDHAAAVDLYRPAIDALTSAFGPENADTVDAQAEFAYHLERCGDVATARHTHQQLLPVIARAFGAESERATRCAAALRRLAG
jgi:hypothetical protein